jgi:hypothetical protein
MMVRQRNMRGKDEYLSAQPTEKHEAAIRKKLIAGVPHRPPLHSNRNDTSGRKSDNE